jgi:hypothetical protein
MSVANPLNVYSGPDSMKKYFDPDYQPPLPLVEIPRKLNPYYNDGIRIYAKLMTMLPAHNVKALPGQLTRFQHSNTTDRSSNGFVGRMRPAWKNPDGDRV